MSYVEADVLNAIAGVFVGVPGLSEGVYSAGGNDSSGVLEIPDDIFDGPMPAVVVLDGDLPVIAGSWERGKWAVEATVWVPDISPRGEAYRTLLNLGGPIRQAFREKGRAGIPDTVVQACVITGIGKIHGRQWSRAEGAPWGLVLPISFEVAINQAVTYHAR